jgi:hypothetical protein
MKIHPIMSHLTPIFNLFCNSFSHLFMVVILTGPLCIRVMAKTRTRKKEVAKVELSLFNLLDCLLDKRYPIRIILIKTLFCLYRYSVGLTCLSSLCDYSSPHNFRFGSILSPALLPSYIPFYPSSFSPTPIPPYIPSFTLPSPSSSQSPTLVSPSTPLSSSSFTVAAGRTTTTLSGSLFFKERTVLPLNTMK